MFTEETVFILGAGSSCDYDYPTGEALVTEVIKETKSLTHDIDNYIQRNSISNLAQFKYVEELLLPNYSEQIASENFLKQCKTLVQKLETINPPVIDHFLNYNRDVVDIGKFIISIVITKCERKFLKKTSFSKIDNYVGKDWHRFIVHKLISNCKSSSDLLKNKVKFITFNYDSTLESSLWRSLSLTNLFSETDIQLFFSQEQKRFMHVYGKIREDYMDEAIAGPKSDEYTSWLWNNKEFLDRTYQSSKGIRTIYGDDKDQYLDTIKYAEKSISHAKNVYILGYGFDEQNNNRLNLLEHLNYKSENKKRIYFTNYNDKQTINKRVSKLFLGALDRFHPNDKFIIELDGFVYEKSIRSVYGAIDQDFDF